MRNRPSNWPTNVVYLDKPVFHSSVTASIKTHIHSPSLATSFGAEGVSPSGSKVVIRKIQDTGHPANGQYGLFAGKKIPPNSFLLDYIGMLCFLSVGGSPMSLSSFPASLGQVHCDDRPESDYDLSLLRLPDGTSVGVDANRMGNEARFVNDYRGIKKRRNAVFADYWTRSGELRIGIKSCEEIKKGEEILVSYGKSWWSNRSASTEINDTADDT